MDEHDNSNDIKKDPAAFISEHPTDDGGDTQQRNPYQEFNDRLNYWRLKWRHRPSNWVPRRVSRLLEVIALFVGVGTLVAIVVGGYFAYQQLCVMQGQLATYQKQLEVTDRAWVKAEVRLIRPFIRGADNVSVPLLIELTNVGRSVARGIDIEFVVIPNAWGEDGFTIPIKEQERLCKVAVGRNARTRILTLFPMEERIINGSAAMDFRLSLKTTSTYGSIGGSEPVMPVVIGCVDYEVGPASNHHQTMFLYNVYPSDPQNPFRTIFQLSLLPQLPITAMRLEKWFPGGNDAN